jgi:hypothetical protein
VLLRSKYLRPVFGVRKLMPQYFGPFPVSQVVNKANDTYDTLLIPMIPKIPTDTNDTLLIPMIPTDTNDT